MIELSPVQHGVIGEPINSVASRPNTDLGDPATEISRGKSNDGDDARGDLLRFPGEIREEAAKRLL